MFDLKVLTRMTALAALVGLVGCSEDPTAPEDTTDVNGYIQSLPTWREFAPLAPDENAPAGDASDPVTDTIGDTDYSCVTTPYSITSTPDRLAVFNPDSEILWLGALLQGKGHRNGLGSLAELPIRQRAPVTVFIDLLTDKTTRTVSNPTAATVGQAIGELVDIATQSGHQAGSRIFFDLKQTHSVRQAALELGVSARYLGTTVTSELDYEQSLEQNTLTAYFVQQMYTTSVVLPQTPSEVFSDAFNGERLQEQVNLGRLGPENLPTYISNIVWGRMLMVTMTSSHSVSQMEAALTATNDAIGSGSVAAEYLEVLDESTFRISTVGGNDEGVENLIRTGQLGDYFDASLALSQARPLSYTVRNLADNSIATVSETTEYNLKECSTSQATPTGARYRLTLDKLEMVEVSGCDPITAPSPELYYSFSLTTGSGTSLITSRGRDSAVTVAEGGFHTLPASPQTVALYADGRTGSMRITGTVWDMDVGSSDDTLGSWDISYNYGVSNGQRYFTRGSGCRVRLYLTITKQGNLYD